MPNSKPCACTHLKVLHNIRHGRNEGACSVAGCECRRYAQKDVESGPKDVILPQDEEMRKVCINLRSALLNAAKQLENYERLLASKSESGLNATEG